MGGTIKKCLICLKGLKPRKKTIPKNSLEEQLVIIYFLQKLAYTPISNKDLERFLCFGNPSEWAALCYKCENQVKECLDMHREVERMIAEITEARRKLYEESFGDESSGSSDDDDGDKQDDGTKLQEGNSGFRIVFNQLRQRIFSQFKAVEEGTFESPISLIYGGTSLEAPVAVAKQALAVTKQSEVPTARNQSKILIKQEYVNPPNDNDDQDDSFFGTIGDDNSVDDGEIDKTLDHWNTSKPTIQNTVTVEPRGVEEFEEEEGSDEIDLDSEECPKCQRVFRSAAAMRRHHTEKHSQSKKTFKCSVCLKVYPRIDTLRTHINLKHPDQAEELLKLIRKKTGKTPRAKLKPLTTFQCQYCPRTFFVRRVLKMHIMSAHKPKGQLGCHLCGQRFDRRNHLKTHMRLKHELIMPGVRELVKTDSTEKSFPCPDCEKVCKSQGNLTRHIRERHEKVKDFVCPHCGDAFCRRPELQRHIYLTHLAEPDDDGPTKCNLCDKMCSSAWTFANHMRSVHNEVPTFECDVCGKTYANPRTLKIHKSFKHGKTRIVSNQEILQDDTSQLSSQDREEGVLT